jgi:formate dehydrogenase subunit gamma
VLIHSTATLTAICVFIVHVYAIIWLRGTFQAMLKGYVTSGWACKHYRKWLKELVVGRRVEKGDTAPAE